MDIATYYIGILALALVLLATLYILSAELKIRLGIWLIARGKAQEMALAVQRQVSTALKTEHLPNRRRNSPVVMPAREGSESA